MSGHKLDSGKVSSQLKLGIQAAPEGFQGSLCGQEICEPILIENGEMIEM